MRVENLAQLHPCLLDPSPGKHLILEAGVHEINRTLQITCNDLHLEGERTGGRTQTILKRGRLGDGTLFAGPLIKGEGASGLVLSNLIINGSRFEETPQGPVDHRHPLTQARESSLFACARACAPPLAYHPENFYTSFETDLLFLESSRITIQDVSFHNPIKFGIGLGDGTRQALLDTLHIVNGGDGGIWGGLASLTTRLALPLPSAIAQKRPQEISIRNCLIENCGASGIYLEAAQVKIDACTLRGNHGDFPFNHDGGQLEIDYKSEDIEVQNCSILNAPSLARTIISYNPIEDAWQPRSQILRAVGIEAFGAKMRFFDNRIERNSHEGIHFNGASQVWITGTKTQIRANHTAHHLFPELGPDPQQNISITTQAAYRDLNAVARGFLIEGIQCENGIMFWSDGSVPDLTVDEVTVRGCNLRGSAGSGVIISQNAAGGSIEGRGWLIEGNRCAA
jgi:hypothetical protein